MKLLNTRFSGRCMLPKLQDIRWISASPKHIEPTLRLIVSPALTNFRLALRNYGPISASQLVPALEALAPAYNSLVEIRICHSTIHDPRTIHAASTLLLKCNPDKLLYFHVDSALSVEAFIHATQLPNLEAFTFRAHTTELGIPLPTSTFPSLRSLDVITVNTDSPLLQAITHIQSTTFTGLRLEFPAATVGTFLPATLATLRPRGLHQTLTRLSITPEGDFNLDGAALRPLLFLNQLTMLEVWLHCSQGQCPYKLSDENLEALVKAMPKLKSLCLGSIPCSHPANTTLKSLVSIAKYCKYLDELVIHTNVETIIAGVPQYDNWGEDRTLEALNPTLVGCPLRNIIFGPCFIPGEQRGAVTFALTLLRLFPSLVRATAFHPTPETDPQWELVDDVIVSHTRARVNIMDAGKFSNLFPCTRFAHVAQLLIRVSTESCVCSLYLNSPVSRALSALYSSLTTQEVLNPFVQKSSLANAQKRVILMRNSVIKSNPHHSDPPGKR